MILRFCLSSISLPLFTETLASGMATDARMASTAMTITSSISVNPFLMLRLLNIPYPGKDFGSVWTILSIAQAAEILHHPDLMADRMAEGAVAYAYTARVVLPAVQLSLYMYL